MLKVVIDTNLFISYLIGGKLTEMDTLFLGSKKLRMLSCAQQLQEVRLVGRREKFRKYFSEKNLETLLENIDAIAELVEITSDVNICRDAKDNYLLALSKDGEADYLVS